MNLQAMINHVATEIRNTNIQANIISWLNLALIDVCTNYEFGALNAYGTITTASGTPSYPLPADYAWLKNIEIPAERRPLYPEDENRIALLYPDYRTLKGTVTHYYLNGPNIGFYHVPDSIKAITHQYQRNAAPLVNLNDICELAGGWHLYLCQWAITRGYSSDSRNDDVRKSQVMEGILLKGLKASEYARPDYKRRMGGSVTLGGRLGRPTLPYPRITPP